MFDAETPTKSMIIFGGASISPTPDWTLGHSWIQNGATQDYDSSCKDKVEPPKNTAKEFGNLSKMGPGPSFTPINGLSLGL